MPDVAQMPPGSFGQGDASVQAVAQFAFGDAGRTYGDPELGARAAAALDFMAGAARVVPGWDVSPETQGELLTARQEVRNTLHVRPAARSQDVTDALLAATRAFAANDNAAAATALDRSGAFAAPGTQVVNTLSNLPYIRDANLATQHAADELANNDTEYHHF